ncbi:hypothetical protein AQUCO_01500271v1 [Aquilegia coerulea]|uniref:Uncharacterized protein n=1 Tax=Aquilegia coerulea TaxID=218851 RepID=A0A2G5DSW7_AQUCA|nr:hypothetical protein AQUCO_01500271v1 [Aquilegia coerulea]PIA46614.1 hypothetical protein AQUCO_01500271v1 [Aquilegia coerulea]
MTSIFESIQKKSFFPTISDSLPVSQASTTDQSLRRRLSSLSVKIQPISAPASSWAFHKSKSMSSMGEYAGSSIRKWWDWSWAWILTKKPTFAADLEMNEEESALLGFHNKGSWRHVFYKVKAEFRKIVGSNNHVDKGFRYDSYSYQQNFDDGIKIKKCEN